MPIDPSIDPFLGIVVPPRPAVPVSPPPAPPPPLPVFVKVQPPLSTAQKLALQAAAKLAVAASPQAWQDYYNDQLMQLNLAPDNSVWP